MPLTQEEKQAKADVSKYFKGIGKSPYDTPFEMKFTDGINIFTEEPDDTFTSLNYISKIFKKIKPSMYTKIITKPQAIRFIRITEQYLLEKRGKPYTFILPDNFPFELTGTENNIKFLRRINKRFDELREIHNIVEEDIINDMPDILKVTNENSSSLSSETSNSGESSVSFESVKEPVKVPKKVPPPKKAPKRVIERADVLEPAKVLEPAVAPLNVVEPAVAPVKVLEQPNLNLNAPEPKVVEEEYTREEYIEDVTEMFEYELQKLDKEDKLRIEARIKEDERKYDDIEKIEREAQMEVDAFIERTVNKYKGSLLHHYKHSKYAYDESKREEILDDYILKLPNIRNRYFLAEYIKPKINIAGVLNVRKRMEEHPRNKFTQFRINLKHYSIKDRRNIEEKLLSGVPLHQIRKDYKPVPRKARPKTQRNANKPHMSENKEQSQYKEVEQKGQHGYKPKPRQPSKKTTVYKANAPVTQKNAPVNQKRAPRTQKNMPKPRGKPVPK